MNEQTARIRVDHREEASGVLRALSGMPGIAVERTTLEIGDYEIADGVFVERKSAADFSASIIDCRMFEQVAAAKDRGACLIVLVEGDPLSIGRLHDNAIIGAISYLAVVEGLRTVSVPTARHSPQMLATMARHAQHGLGYEITMRAATPKTTHEQQVFVLCGLPGIGMDKAQRLLAHFGSAAAVLQASAVDLCAVDGMGTKGAAKLRAMLDHDGR